MKHVFRRILLVMVVLLLAMGAVVPAAMAADNAIVSNAQSIVYYVGMRDTLYATIDGEVQASSALRWKSSKPTVVSINQYGNIVAKKIGKSTISATRKRDGRKISASIVVKRNKVDNIKPRPSASAAAYKTIGVRLKSVEIVSPSKIVAEYYLACNFPPNWKLTKIKTLEDAINLYNRSTGQREKIIVGDDYQLFAKSISGFKPRSGQFVQVIKATFTGSRIDTNAKLSDYTINDSDNVKVTYDYTY